MAAACRGGGGGQAFGPGSSGGGGSGGDRAFDYMVSKLQSKPWLTYFVVTVVQCCTYVSLTAAYASVVQPAGCRQRT